MTETELKMEFLKDTGFRADPHPQEYLQWVKEKYLNLSASVERLEEIIKIAES